MMLHYSANLKAIRYESSSLNRIVADKSHRVIVANTSLWHGREVYDIFCRIWFNNETVEILSQDSSMSLLTVASKPWMMMLYVVVKCAKCSLAVLN